MKLEISTSPLEYAQNQTSSDLKKTIKAIKKGEYDEFSDRCRVCFEKYLAGDLEQAQWWSKHAEIVR